MIASFDDNGCGCHCACCQRHECGVQPGFPIYRGPGYTSTADVGWIKGISTGGNVTAPTIWYSQPPR
jgi:hypothetical protein